jgi:hypothetical protein
MTMGDINRRDALLAASTAGVAAVIGGSAVARGGEGGGKEAQAVKDSGNKPVPESFVEKKPEAKYKGPERLAAGAFGALIPLTPDADPGRNIATISVPAGTRAISAWATEYTASGASHAGGAYFRTTSVQMFNNGTQCRVEFNLDWGNHLPSALQVIFAQ